MPVCPICKSSTQTILLRGVPDYITGEPFGVDVCDGCGLGMIVPMPAPQEIDRYYPARYRTNRQRQTAGFRVRRRAGEIVKLFPSAFAGRVLDLGCGRGDFIAHMRSLGWDVGATEIDAEKVASLRAQGVDARTPDRIDEPPAWKGTFDAVTCWHVLEHVLEPGRLLRQAHDALKPGGFLDVTVPDFGSPQARRWGADWFALDAPRHLFHFSRDNLARLLAQAGFVPVRWRVTAVEYDLFGEIQSGLNARSARRNELFEALTGESGSAHRPRLGRRLAVYAVAIPRALVALPRFASDVARGRGGTLWVTCRKG